MSFLHLRLPMELKEQLQALPGPVAEHAREALRRHARVAFLAEALTASHAGLAGLVLDVAEDVAVNGESIDERAEALQWLCVIDLSLDAARRGEQLRQALTPPDSIRNKAARLAAVLATKDE